MVTLAEVAVLLFGRMLVTNKKQSMRLLDDGSVLFHFNENTSISDNDWSTVQGELRSDESLPESRDRRVQGGRERERRKKGGPLAIIYPYSLQKCS